MLADGSAGRCRLVATCVGVTIAQIAANECPLLIDDGQSGVCCADVTTNQVHIISDGGSGTLTPVLSLSANVVNAVVDAAEAEDILRIGLEDDGGAMEETTRTAPRLAARPPLSKDVDGETDDDKEDDDDQVNFIDDSEPNEFHLRFNMPRASSLAVDASAHALLQTTRRLKEANNLTDLEAGLGLRSQFNSDTSDVIDAHCPWTPEPTCDPNQVREE